MRTIQDIYTQYRIPPNLQLHLFRVSAFALYIADHLKLGSTVDRHFITVACLFHDIGNIVKFDFRLGKHPDIPESEVSKWEAVQTEYIAKYGNEENDVVIAIVEEIGLAQEVKTLLMQTGIEKIRYALASENWSIKLVRLADERISPHGVVTVKERYADFLARYRGRHHHLADIQENKERIVLAINLEKQIQSQCTIDLQTITDADIEPYIERLREYEI